MDIKNRGSQTGQIPQNDGGALKAPQMMANTTITNPASGGTQSGDSEQPDEKVTIYFDGEEMEVENIHVRIISQANEHIAARLTGLIKAGSYDSYIKKAKRISKITIEHTIKGETALKYEGIITFIQGKAEWAAEEQGIYLLTVRALSHTYLLDIAKQRRSFQDKEMLYPDMFRELLKDFEGADFIDNVTEGVPLTVFVLQYLNTIWEFIKLEVSKFEHAIYAVATTAAPKLHVGCPQGVDRGALEEYEYTITKDLMAFGQMDQNEYEHETSEFDFMQYEIFDAYAKETFELGDRVSYQGVGLRVCYVESEIKDNKLYNSYKLTTENGMKRPRLVNDNIQGLSIPGQVIDVQDNRLKLHLEIDEEQPVDTAYWFDYATFYATWYGMPEVNDWVNLHFPNLDERDAIGLNSFKQNPSSGYTRNNAVETPENTSAAGNKGPIDFVKSASDPDVKLLTTKAGRMIELGPDRICILYNDGTYAILDDSDGITLYTDRDITAYAKGEVNLDADERVHIQAEKQITLQSESSVIELTPSTVTVFANEKKMN